MATDSRANVWIVVFLCSSNKYTQLPSVHAPNSGPIYISYMYVVACHHCRNAHIERSRLNRQKQIIKLIKLTTKQTWLFTRVSAKGRACDMYYQGLSQRICGASAYPARPYDTSTHTIIPNYTNTPNTLAGGHGDEYDTLRKAKCDVYFRAISSYVVIPNLLDTKHWYNVKAACFTQLTRFSSAELKQHTICREFSLMALHMQMIIMYGEQ